MSHMSSIMKRLRELKGEFDAMGSIALLPAEDFGEFGRLCLELLYLTEDLAAPPAADDSPEDCIDQLVVIALTLRRSGDDVTATEIFLRTACFADTRGLGRLSSLAYNLAGISFYNLGQYESAIESFEQALERLTDDEHGLVRSTIIRLNWGNVLHDQRRFDEAECVYESVLKQVDEIPADVFSGNSAFESDRMRGMLCNNLGANRTEWARSDSGHGAESCPHLTIAEHFLSRAIAAPLSPNEHLQARTNFAHSLILRGRPDEAERELRQLASQCAADRDLMLQLPEIYRFTAESRVAQGDHRGALTECYRALESSLAVADRLQERKVVDTFVAAMRVTSSVLIVGSDSRERKAERLMNEASDFVDRLVDFLERKDLYTGLNHSKAVQTLSVRTARVLVSDTGPAGERA
ncbi:MAG: tetratricopeptide repeat protein, partial [Acidobacteria bacterium]|nr:tetratricopeptide repeat protein [Acidobacteriota bacterium]